MEEGWGGGWGMPQPVIPLAKASGCLCRQQATLKNPQTPSPSPFTLDQGLVILSNPWF